MTISNSVGSFMCTPKLRAQFMSTKELPIRDRKNLL
jgi:hypothetical protein